jgi:hypothetical protein
MVIPSASETARDFWEHVTPPLAHLAIVIEPRDLSHTCCSQCPSGSAQLGGFRTFAATRSGDKVGRNQRFACHGRKSQTAC